MENIIFVFDGVNIPLKTETEFIRRNEKINSVKDFYSRIVWALAKPNKKNTPNMITPSPLAIMTFVQFLLDVDKKYDNIKIKFSLLEADSYIAQLANEYNG